MQIKLQNGISDNFLLSCLSVKGNICTYIYLYIQHYLNIRTFTFLSFFLLFTTSVILYTKEKGFHTKLQAYYENIKFSENKFAFLISFSYCFAQALECAKTESPCIYWEGNKFLTMNYVSFTPNSDITLLTTILIFIMKIKGEGCILRIICSLLLLILVSVLAVLGGISTIIQLISSISLGAFICFLFDFLPPIAVPIASTASTFIFLIVSACFVSSESLKENGQKILFSTISLLLATVLELISFVRNRGKYWFLESKKDESENKKSTVELELKTDTSDDDDEGAVIPDAVGEEEATEMKETFEVDIIETCAVLSVYLISCFIFTSANKDFTFGVDVTKFYP